MTKQTVTLLKKSFPTLEWCLNKNTTKRKNLYSIKGKIENQLTSQRTDLLLTVYIKKSGKKGEATIHLTQTNDEFVKGERK